METPTYDQTMNLLGSIMEDYQWAHFKGILYNPAKFKAWLRENLQPDGEQATLSAESEQKALEFWAELDREERKMFREAMRKLWGREAAANLPAGERREKGVGACL
jgi:hypothetical protein